MDPSLFVVDKNDIGHIVFHPVDTTLNLLRLERGAALADRKDLFTQRGCRPGIIGRPHLDDIENFPEFFRIAVSRNWKIM